MRITKDGATGGIFLFAGLFVVISAQNHSMGTLQQMGPAFYPTLIGSMTALVGLALIAKSAIKGGVQMPRLAWRQLLLLIGAILVMAFSLERLGLIASTFLLVIISRLASRPFNFLRTLVLATVLSGIGTLIFWYFLKLPLPLWP